MDDWMNEWINQYKNRLSLPDETQCDQREKLRPTESSHSNFSTPTKRDINDDGEHFNSSNNCINDYNGSSSNQIYELM